MGPTGEDFAQSCSILTVLMKNEAVAVFFEFGDSNITVALLTIGHHEFQLATSI